LRPGMRLLDVGCGPGSITRGLAQTVFPGEVVGVDMQSALIEKARVAARGAANARFEVANIYELPFADHSFEAVFANGVLMHLREPVRALAELRRVLRPGGIAGVRDPDFGTALHVPMTSLLEKWLALRAEMRRHDGRIPFLGRHHRGLLLEAGFVRAEARASVESSGSLEETRRRAIYLKAMLQGIARTAVTQEWMDRATLDAVSADLDAWSVRSDAFYAMTWCEAVGWTSDRGEDVHER